jgi:hypothetical protein
MSVQNAEFQGGLPCDALRRERERDVWFFKGKMKESVERGY